MIPTWSSEPSTNNALACPFDSTLKSTLAELSLIVTLPPSNSTLPDAVKVVTVAAAAVFAPMQYYYLYISEGDNTNLAALER